MLLVGVVACSAQGAPSEFASSSSSSIQGGSTDTTHTFAVAVIEQLGGGVALCSGALLAPNLVATARHCVAQISSTTIDCATSTFGAVNPASALTVVTDSTVARTSTHYAVSKILVPSAANQTSVCGNDIALLILSQSITLPEYVTPVINPPMTDHRTYTTTVTAIGYGVTSGNDPSGATSGVRRIKENVNLVCIPNDTMFTNCFPAAAQAMSANEFQSGDAICEGDSGSSAFEQRSFNNGTWVSFGVASRGGVDMDSGDCVGGIYTRFDAWGSLLISAANQAAATGGYSPPGWAVSPEGGVDDASTTSTGADSGTGQPIDSGAGGASGGDSGTSSTAAEAGGACATNGAACSSDSACCSTNCVSRDGGKTFACAACDDSNPCAPGKACQQGVCVPGTGAGAGGSGASGNDGGSGTSGNGAGRSGGSNNGSGASASTTGSGDSAQAAKGCACAAALGAEPEPAPWRSTLVWLSLLGLGLARLRRARPWSLETEP